MQAEGSLPGLFGLLMSDGLIELHFGNYEIAPAERFFRIKQGRESHGAFGKTGEERGFSQGEILGVL